MEPPTLFLSRSTLSRASQLWFPLREGINSLSRHSRARRKVAIGSCSECVSHSNHRAPGIGSRFSREKGLHPGGRSNGLDDGSNEAKLLLGATDDASVCDRRPGMRTLWRQITDYGGNSPAGRNGENPSLPQPALPRAASRSGRFRRRTARLFLALSGIGVSGNSVTACLHAIATPFLKSYRCESPLNPPPARSAVRHKTPYAAVSMTQPRLKELSARIAK